MYNDSKVYHYIVCFVLAVVFFSDSHRDASDIVYKQAKSASLPNE